MTNPETQKPQLQDQKLWKKIPQDPIELLILSHCNGTKTVKDISLIIAKSVAETHQIITRLESLGVLKQSNPPEQKISNSGQIKGNESSAERIISERDQRLIDQSLDIDVELQKEILFLKSHINELNPFEIFGITPQSTDRDLKRSFQKMTLIYHPDRYFGKKISHFKEILTDLFKSINEVYELVNSDEKRAKLGEVYADYFKKDIEMSAPGEIDPDKKDARRRRIRDSIVKITRENSKLPAEVPLEKPSTPRDKPKKLDRLKFFEDGIRERINKAKIHFEEGKKQLAVKNYPGAASHFNLAMTFDPENEEYKKWHKDISKQASEVISNTYLTRGTIEENMGNGDRALNLFKLAHEANPSTQTVIKYVECMIKMKKTTEARDLLLDAISKDEKCVDLKVLLVKTYIAANLYNRANSILKEILEQAPFNREAKRLQKEIADHH